MAFFDSQSIMKYIRVKDLSKLLNQLDPEERLWPNRVGNITIVHSNEMIQLGYVDLSEEEGEELIIRHND